MRHRMADAYKQGNILILIVQPCEEEARHGRGDEAPEPAADEEDGGEPARDVALLGDPRERGPELPGDEEAEAGGSRVEACHAGGRRHAEEHRRGQAQDQRHDDHVPREDNDFVHHYFSTQEGSFCIPHVMFKVSEQKL